ncbi:tetratricopeptide repeat protein 33 isoform X4 [Salmo salar]|uniref:Tetratricopeptide repeat protein 33 isoform X4 n=1 Tax=Salmo salar TaxID=8030 RepID=A0A1S3LV80_SALSA|nr:tetratricopeptide repeat protein 33 isoform X4 [Salmo salar]|eukprot:XP_013994750.1 PREDICTED: tetratricopeptide repeat protein 33-like isoform X4 [Salmo salar]
MLASYLPNSTSRNLTGIPNFRMASFGWKRKVGERVCKAAVQQFEAAAEKPEEDGVDEVDWLHAIKRRREVLLEDCAAKGNRLKEEGTVLAQEGRHWEAIKRWDEAIQLTPDNPLLYEMKSQAVRSFQVAVHLCPSERPLWSEDLAWARRLQQQRRTAQDQTQREEEAQQDVLNPPELQQDYDFESDEVVVACAAVAERQRRYEELKRTVVVVDAEGNSREVPVEEEGSGDTPSSSQDQLVKARGL